MEAIYSARPRKVGCRHPGKERHASSGGVNYLVRENWTGAGIELNCPMGMHHVKVIRGRRAFMRISEERERVDEVPKQ